MWRSYIVWRDHIPLFKNDPSLLVIPFLKFVISNIQLDCKQNYDKRKHSGKKVTKPSSIIGISRAIFCHNPFASVSFYI